MRGGRSLNASGRRDVLDEQEKVARVGGGSDKAKVAIERAGGFVLRMHGERANAGYVGDPQGAAQGVAQQTRANPLALPILVDREARQNQKRDRMTRHAFAEPRRSVRLLNVADDERIEARNPGAFERDIGLGGIRLLRLQGMTDQESIEVGLTACETVNRMHAAELLDA